MSTIIQNRLNELKEEKYQKFTSSLLPGIDNILGVRIPILRKLSKDLTLEDLTDETFEEIMLQGFVIGNIKDFKKMQEQLLLFLPKINNWSITDSFVCSLKITKSHKEEMLKLLESLITSPLEYTRRFILVMLINYYIDAEYLKKIIPLIKQIKKEEYYVKMAYSWLLTEIYIFNEEEGLHLLDKEKDPFIKSKTLSKIRDSYQVATSKKLKLKEKEGKK